MNILLDTNILLRANQPNHPMHSLAMQAVESAISSGHELCLAPQVLYEFWVVATRPAGENGLGLTIGETRQKIDAVIDAMTLLAEPPGLWAEWREVVTTKEVKGKNAHDARLAAFMRLYGISHLMTFNAGDFARFEITIVSPQAFALAGEHNP